MAAYPQVGTECAAERTVQTRDAMLLISHGLKDVEYLSDRDIVMYLGRVMGEAPAQSLYVRPHFPVIAKQRHEPVRETNRRTL